MGFKSRASLVRRVSDEASRIATNLFFPGNEMKAKLEPMVIDGTPSFRLHFLTHTTQQMQAVFLTRVWSVTRKRNFPPS